jgi:hypothetical protein
MGEATFTAADILAAPADGLELKMLKGGKQNKEAMFKLSLAASSLSQLSHARGLPTTASSVAGHASSSLPTSATASAKVEVKLGKSFTIIALPL